MNWPTPQNIITPSNDVEWPRWVKPHPSHIVRRNVEGEPASPSVQPSNMVWDTTNVTIAHGPIVTPGFEHHIDRATGEVTVLVHNEGEERAATEMSRAAAMAENERLAAEQAESERVERERQEAEDRAKPAVEEPELVGEETHHD